MVCHIFNSAWLPTCMYMCIISYIPGKIPCLQSIDTALLSNLRLGIVKRSASLGISDFEEVANIPQSPTRSKASFIRIGSRRKTLGGSLSAGADFPTLRTKQPYMLVKEQLELL